MNKLIIKEHVTTVGMTSAHKGVKDRVVMRKWCYWFEDGKHKKKSFCLRSSTVKMLENKNLSNDFIKKHNLSDRDIQDYENQFDLIRHSWERINLKSSTEVIDLQNRLRGFLSCYFYELNHSPRYKLSLKNCTKPFDADIKAKDSDGFKLIETIDRYELIKLIEESKLLTLTLEEYLSKN